VHDALQRRPLDLELGCGETKRNPDAVGIDTRALRGVDVVADALDALRSLPDGSVDSISSSHFLEHVDDLEAVLRESARVLRQGGRFLATTPHFSNPYFYSDPTHRGFFGLYTFCYFVETSPLRRQVPHYIDPLPFVLHSPTLGFKSTSPFYGRHACKQVLEKVFNRSRWLKEFYEENLCWMIPCYEITYDLRRT
jgi:ubiquinone/menaquinone biosynthesis C-methylase UbiE